MSGTVRCCCPSAALISARPGPRRSRAWEASRAGRGRVCPCPGIYEPPASWLVYAVRVPIEKVFQIHDRG